MKVKNFILSFIFLSFGTAAFAIGNVEDADFASAEKAFRSGVYDMAQTRLESFLKVYPHTAYLYQAHSLLGQCYYHQNIQARALYEFDLVLNAPGGNNFQDEALYWSGEVYFGAGDFNKSIELYQRLIDDNPSSKYLPYAIYARGWSYYKLGLLDEAERSFRNTIARYPLGKTAAEAKFRIGEIEYLLGRYDAAEKELAEFEEKFPVSEKTADAYYLSGEVMFYRSKYKDAAASFERALKISPEAKWSYFARYRMAMALAQLGDYEASSKQFGICISKTSNQSLLALSILGLAQNYEHLGSVGQARLNDGITSVGQAMDRYEEVIDRYPDNESTAEAYYRKARLLLAQSKYKEAEAACKEGIAKFPKSGYIDDLHYELGLVYDKDAENDNAIKEFMWVKVESKDANLAGGAASMLGDIYLGREDYKSAMENYDVVLSRYTFA